ncbi:hypothetical protein [Candidatus Bathycorpusculum sp.]|uniref:hypothetical protein n=1 Tax=Candidatus Bathycorpusculum sp. TaxID=2994959 RepID=UPI00282018E0|nr:hypothetical protein [Candidatus Termitimicrobium sp.]MCL2685954.1 hypothetical protein [Candidatus Termitimicrobium sp.]
MKPNPQQTKQLSRRTVKTVAETLKPNEIFELIHQKEGDYTLENRRANTVRDRALMALCFLTGGRITEIVGGKQYHRFHQDGKVETKPIGRHPGLTIANLEISEDFLTINSMAIVKRSPQIIQRYGAHIAQRSQLRFPLKRKLYKNKFRDQLVPFSWLVMEYLYQLEDQKKTSADVKLFPFQDTRAWKIINDYTDKFPNWFRVQAERFYGFYIFKDFMIHSKFMGKVNPMSSAPYIRFTDDSDIKDLNKIMDFKWIDSAVAEIKTRIKL